MVRVLIVGAGAMAERHVQFMAPIPGCEIWGVVEPGEARRADFAERFGIPRRFATIDEALAQGGFDAVSNVTPDAVHVATTLPFLERRIPVFCEKPLAPTYPEALGLAEAAERAGVVNMVNLRYRGLAVIEKGRELVASGAIGEVRHLDAAYLQSWLVAKHWGDWRTEPRWLWRLSSEHGSKGVLGDVGIHILDLATYVAGEDVASIYCRLKTFEKAPDDRIGEYGIDANDSFVMSVEFGNGAIGTIHASRYAVGYSNAQKLRLYGTEGAVEIDFESEVSGMRACLGDDVDTQTWRAVEAPPVPLLYERFVEAVRTGVQAEPSFARAVALQKVLDLCFETDASGKAARV